MLLTDIQHVLKSWGPFRNPRKIPEYPTVLSPAPQLAVVMQYVAGLRAEAGEVFWGPPRPNLLCHIRKQRTRDSGRGGRSGRVQALNLRLLSSELKPPV